MATFVNMLNQYMTTRLGMSPDVANLFDESIIILGITGLCLLANWALQSFFRWISRHGRKLKKSKWNTYLTHRRLGKNILLLVPGIIFYLLIPLAFEKGDPGIRLLRRIDITYLLVTATMICNSLLMTFLDAYSKSDRYRSHPLKGLIQGIQIALYFVVGIIIVAVLIDKSPAALLTGLGASAAVLMLIFKDSILGFVAGVQMSQNDMIKLGDWIQMPDGSANGTVEEITLNTVKVRNWDNTLSMIPPYTLVNTPFKNWRGMQESGGRRADKCIFIDINSLEICSEDTIADLIKSFPMLRGHVKASVMMSGRSSLQLTNIELFRVYIEEYLKEHPDVNPSLDIIVTQKEATAYGLPIEVYFFIKDKTWAVYERKQSDIFDYLMTVAPDFGLRLYQRP